MDEKTDFEKLIESAHALARVVREYYMALMQEGFSEKQAFELAVEYQNSILGMAKPRGQEKE